MEMLSRIGHVLEQIRTPLSIAGLVVLVLYLLYKQILGMSIFSQVGSAETVVLIDRIAFYLFCLASLGLVLGLIGYVRSIAAKGHK